MTDPDLRPFVAPCRELDIRAPVKWLKSGWQDFRSAPGLSLVWGGFCWFLSTVVTVVAWKMGGWVLLISLLSGFIFVAPLLAFDARGRRHCLQDRFETQGPVPQAPEIGPPGLRARLVLEIVE